MPLPPLFKYLDLQGARLTLVNRTFKHSKPSDFNDIEDLTIQSIFPEDTETALKRIASSFTDVILRHLNEVPTCSSPMKEKVALIQQVFSANHAAAEKIKSELAREGQPIFDVERTRVLAASFLQEINDLLQRYRVLCVTTLIDSEKMWVNYAENHKGIALRIEPNIAKDSKFQLFRPIVYHEKRPPLYEDALDFIVSSMFGDHQLRRRAMIEKVVYAKTLAWKHECEYRLAIPLGADEQPWNTLRYHPNEIRELYLGLAIEKAAADEIQSVARVINPNITVFQTVRRIDGTLGFNHV